MSAAEGLLNRVTTIGATCLYVVVLQVVYLQIIAPAYAYLGYTARPLPFDVVFGMTVLAAFPAVWLPLQLSRPSILVYWALYIVAYVPSVVIPFYALDVALPELMRFALALFFALGCFGLIYLLPLLRIRRPAVPPRVFLGAIGLLTVGAATLVVWTFGIPKGLPDLGSIYEVREDYRAELQSSGRLVGLAITWLVSVVGPLLIAVGLVWRSWRAAVLGIFIELFAFAVTGYKSALLAPAAIVAVYSLIRYGSRSLSSILSVGVVFLIGSAVFLDAIMNQIIITSWLVRRLLVTPGLIAGRFFEYFSENGFAHLGHSVLAPFVEAPYTLSPPELIGLAYDGRVYSANANFWADGFANFGVLGLLIATLIVAAVAYLVDSISIRLELPNRQIVALLLIQPAITLSNSAVITSLVSHGLLIVVLVVLVAPRQLVPGRSRSSSRVGPVTGAITGGSNVESRK